MAEEKEYGCPQCGSTTDFTDNILVPGTFRVANFDKDGGPVHPAEAKLDWDHVTPNKSRYHCTNCKKDFDSPVRVGSMGDNQDRTLPLHALSPSELATILHGLRLIQEKANGPLDCMAGCCAHFDEADELNDEQIDALCERLSS
jgi:DNA-directed RNA polymerase subunit RPC12/RpoP